ncbi:hypothetical protein GOODEAATRI_031155, partial [Goodea atripinnis]
LWTGNTELQDCWRTDGHSRQLALAANLRVYLGRQSQQGSNPNEVFRTVAQVIIHKDFKVSTLDNDIALVKLSSAVTFTSYISPVCLAASDSTFYSGVNSWVTGWGNTGFS